MNSMESKVKRGLDLLSIGIGVAGAGFIWFFIFSVAGIIELSMYFFVVGVIGVILVFFGVGILLTSDGEDKK